MAIRLALPEILHRISEGEAVTKGQLEEAASAAASLRSDFLRDAFVAVGGLTPHTAEFLAFKNCLKSITDLLLKHGLVAVAEVQVLWLRIEEVER